MVRVYTLGYAAKGADERLSALMADPLTVLLAVNRWDLPVMIWLGVVFGVLAFVSGLCCFALILDI